jgi:acyl carrier protein
MSSSTTAPQTTFGAPGESPHGVFSDERANEILDIISKETGVGRALLLPEATLDELGIPSLDLTQAVFEIETHFDVEIPVVADRDGAEFTTIGALVDHVLRTLDRAAAARTETPSGNGA